MPTHTLSSQKPKAVLHRMDLPNYTCGYGTAALDLLERNGFNVEDNVLRTRHETDAFKDKHHITTTPLVFIDGVKIGGFTDLQKHLNAQKPKRKGFFSR
ncbi:glutaredoxin [Pacificibacter sp. AS14]|uniref:glutaredoxin family protein n=1 Tax=Pacificibacter sp. AS14 TaxID=3135785 RepID=UPI00316C9A3C